MFQALFGGGFNPTKTKTQLRLCVSRIKLLQNKKTITIRQQRKDIAALLAAGKEDSARIRVEALIQEQSCSLAYEILELYCELLSVRVELMKVNKSLPEDMKESVASVIYAERRCAMQLPELKVVKDQLQAKYGKEYIGRCQNDETCVFEQVNPRIIDSLAIKVPPPKQKLALLSEIALEHNVDWEVVTVPDSPEENDEGHDKHIQIMTTQEDAAAMEYPPVNQGTPYPTIEFTDEDGNPDTPMSQKDNPLTAQGIAVGQPVHPGDASSSQATTPSVVLSPKVAPASAPVLGSDQSTSSAAAGGDCDCCSGGGDVPDLPDTPSPLLTKNASANNNVDNDIVNDNVVNVKLVDVDKDNSGMGPDAAAADDMDDLSKRLDALKTGAQLPKPPKDL